MDSLLIRPAVLEDAEAIAKVHVESWQTAYQGIIDEDFLAALSRKDNSFERRVARWRADLTASAAQSGVYLAETAGEVVGFVSYGRERDNDPLYQGELYAIYLLQEWRGQGIGRRLWDAAVAAFRDQEINSLLVWVLAANPARRFYECLGGQYVREKEIGIGQQRLREVAYGWLDLSTDFTDSAD